MDSSLWSIDWRGIAIPSGSVLELIVRGTLMYMIIFLLIRVVPKRQVGALSPSDILVVVLIAEVAGSAFGRDYRSVSEGTVLVATVLFWSFAIDWLQHRFPRVEQLLREPKVKVIENGRMLRRNMHREFLSHEELMAQLREAGVEEVAKVKAAYMEADGRISVIKR
ncbi:MAG TPA: YetF domain-containing protein [Reyranellaceae bacterium]|nr:YetF domain-containing protein [Reyranellaceae bacterium]